MPALDASQSRECFPNPFVAAWQLRDVTPQEQELRHLQMDAQVCHLEIKAKGVKVVFKSNVIYLRHLIRKDDKKGLY